MARARVLHTGNDFLTRLSTGSSMDIEEDQVIKKNWLDTVMHDLQNMKSHQAIRLEFDGYRGRPGDREKNGSTPSSTIYRI